LTELDGRQVELLLISDDGSVRNVTTTGEDRLSFTLRPGPELANGKAQLLVAIGSNMPVAAVHVAKLPTADKLFPQIIAEADKNNQQLVASAKLFKIDR
jgi:serine/threonine-protein kinase